MQNKQSPVPFYVGTLLLLAIGVIITLAAFKWEQPCDIDNVVFWCRVHPFGLLDAIGLMLFYIGILYQSYIWVFKWNSFMDSKVLNSLGIVVLGIGFVLMWLK